MVAGFAVASSVWMGLAGFQTGTPTQQTNWVGGAWRKKVQEANSINGPRVLIASGSSGLFDIRASQIQHALGVPCVNISLHAGLGLDFLVDRFEKIARPGDTVVFLPEYEMFGPIGHPSTVLVDYVFSQAPDYLRSMPPAERIHWMLALPPDRLMEGVRNKLRHKVVVDDPTSVYRASAIDEYGDETANLASLQKPNDRFALTRVQPCPTVEKGTLAPSALKRMDDFVRWCRSNDIQILIAYPATVDFPGYREPAAREFFAAIQTHFTKENVPVLGTAADSFYPITAFYDTEYHLESRGTTVNTDKLIANLRPYVKK